MVSIAQERSKLAALGVDLRRREEWQARFDYTGSRAVHEPATRVFIHITVTNPGSYASFDEHARAIENIGITRFPATGISYNRLFMAGTRTVYEGQPIGRRGAHTVNDFERSTCTTSGCPGRGGPLSAPSWNLNINARSYVYCANVQHSVPDHVVDDMARVIAADKLAGFVTRDAEIHGHRCVSSKSCPGDKMWARMGEIDKLADHYLSTGLTEDDMPTAKEVAEATIDELQRRQYGTLVNGTQVTGFRALNYGPRYAHLSSVKLNDVRTNQATQLKLLAEIKAGMGAADVDSHALAAELLPLLAPLLIDELADVVGLSEEQVEAAQERVLRRVLGSVAES